MTYKITAPDWMLSDASRIVSGAFEIGAGAGEVIGIGRSIDVLRALREEKKAQNDEIAVEVISWVIDRAVSELDVDTAISDFKSVLTFVSSDTFI